MPLTDAQLDTLVERLIHFRQITGHVNGTVLDPVTLENTAILMVDHPTVLSPNIEMISQNNYITLMNRLKEMLRNTADENYFTNVNNDYENIFNPNGQLPALPPPPMLTRNGGRKRRSSRRKRRSSRSSRSRR